MLILASSSPRRRSLLKMLDIDFEVASADVNETPLPGEYPAEMTMRLARLKADSLFQRSPEGYRVLGGDTTVALDNEAMGKPRDHDEAVSMLASLSGKTHTVYSAVALAHNGSCPCLLSESRVTFRELDERTILQYCHTEDPYDKAGAYGIQGPAGNFVAHLEGSYSGVMGLPLWHTHQLLFHLNPG